MFTGAAGSFGAVGATARRAAAGRAGAANNCWTGCVSDARMSDKGRRINEEARLSMATGEGAGTPLPTFSGFGALDVLATNSSISLSMAAWSAGLPGGRMQRTQRVQHLCGQRLSSESVAARYVPHRFDPKLNTKAWFSGIVSKRDLVARSSYGAGTETSCDQPHVQHEKPYAGRTTAGSWASLGI